MNIDDKLKDIKKYFVSLRYGEGIPMIDVQFEDKWIVPKSKIINVQKYPDKPNRYLFYSEREEILVDDMVDYISQVIKTNIDREQKYLLLKSKIMELQQFFGEHSLDELQKLKFIIEEDLTELDGLTMGQIDVPEKIESEDKKVEVIEEEKVEDN